MSMPLVSVIIPAFNAAHFLKASLDSVYVQNYSALEVIVIDDGSEGNTAEIVSLFPDVKYVYQKNQGDAAARNRGIRLARGDFLAFLDADDLWLADKLNLQMEQHRENPNIDYSVTLQICFLDSTISSRPLWLRENLLHTPQIGQLPTMIAHRSIFDKVGLFNELLPIGSDAEWIARCKDADVEYMVVTKLLSKRRVHNTNLSYQSIQLNNSILLNTLKESVMRKRLKHASIN